MSLFRQILEKIFPADHPAVAAAPTAPIAPPSSTPVSSPVADPAIPSTAPDAAPPVDVAALLDRLAAQSRLPTNWRESIVDLLKLLQLDSALPARKELAHELGYGGDTSDSATLNIWLHTQVMKKLAENGGQVPDELRT